MQTPRILKSVLSHTNRFLLRTNFPIHSIRCSTVSERENSFFHYERDPGIEFINPKVQRILKSLTQVQLEKIYRKRTVTDNTVEYKFMTTEELEKQYQEAINNVHYLLQMPPIVKVKEDTVKAISKDPGLSKFSESKFVITDITYGLRQSQRKVVIRQTDGSLEHVPQDIRKRMNQIYFPLAGRQVVTPRMFEPENLKRCLDEGNYEFVLDRLCVQYEPYEKEYHDISATVYLHINENKRFEDLRSTRHFGPLSFFLAWHRMIDDLLYDMIKKDYLRNGVELITLMDILNGGSIDEKIFNELNQYEPFSIKDKFPKALPIKSNDIQEEIKISIGKSREDFVMDEICLKFIEEFVKTKALKKVPLELAVQSYRESNDEKKKLLEGLIKAHGVN